MDKRGENMLDDSKQSAESYDRTHRETQDFITDTISYVDGYLAGERDADIAEVWDAEAEPREWAPEDQLEYESILDAEAREDWDQRLSKWCQQHDVELVNGKCSACVSEEEEERRNDC